MLFPMTILFGALVGFALRLTGGGGSLLAVPLLVYGLEVAPREAFGVSLAAVGTTALIGVAPRLKAGEVEIRVGVLFAVAGMIGAPAGTWLAGLISQTVLLTLFSILMLFVAWQMWRRPVITVQNETDEGDPTCQRTEDGKLTLTSRCAVLLMLVGLVTGIFSGMFGVGAGFIIVPALVLFSGMPVHRAVATSLLVIALVSVSGVASHFAAGHDISLQVTGLFVVGGVIGLSLAGLVSKRLSGPMLQRVFAVGIASVAMFVVTKTLS